MIKLSFSSLPEDMNHSMVAPWDQGLNTLIYVSRINFKKSELFLILVSQDKVSADGASSDPKTSEFQSCHRVVKKGFKRLISCISMTYKVIKCIEITQNTQILKITDFTMSCGLPSSEIAQNSPKKRVTQSRLLNF